MIMRFVTVFEGAARMYFRLHTIKDMIFREMADSMVNNYHSASAQMKLQAEADGTSLTMYMKRNEIADLREELKGYIEYINRTIPKPTEGPNQPFHKRKPSPLMHYDDFMGKGSHPASRRYFARF